MFKCDADAIRAKLGELEVLVPGQGGFLDINKGPGKGRLIIVGDRVALVRLGAAILKHGLRSGTADGQRTPEAILLEDFFEKPSPIVELFVDIYQLASGESAKIGFRRPSFWRLLRQILFGG